MSPSTGTAKVTLPEDTQILIEREFDAPKDLVFKAYTTPELVKRWWAGRRGEMTLCEIDLRVGGQWRYVMTAAGGFEVAFRGEYREIEQDELVVFTEIFEGAPPMPGDDEGTLNTATFTEADGRTTLSLLTEAPNQMIRDAIIQSGMEAGMQEGMDLLEETAISLR